MNIVTPMEEKSNVRDHEKNIMKIIMKASPPLDYTYNKAPHTNQRTKKNYEALHDTFS